MLKLIFFEKFCSLYRPLRSCAVKKNKVDFELYCELCKNRHAFLLIIFSMSICNIIMEIFLKMGQQG